MRLARRRAFGIGGGFIAALSLPILTARGEGPVEISMQGRADGSHVWFDPIGVHVRRGQTIRWTNLDPGNAHTATAYHPANLDHPRRIPLAAPAWSSDYLLPNGAFSTTLTEPGVYDFFCIPHEHAGMVGRIVVVEPESEGWLGTAGADQGVPEAALRAFPPVEEIMQRGVVRPA